MIVYADASCSTREREEAVAYHRRRAEEELRIAQYADCNEMRRFHYHLAALHLDKVYGNGAAGSSLTEGARAAA